MILSIKEQIAYRLIVKQRALGTEYVKTEQEAQMIADQMLWAKTKDYNEHSTYKYETDFPQEEQNRLSGSAIVQIIEHRHRLNNIPPHILDSLIT